MYHAFTSNDSHEGIENYQGKHLNIEIFKLQIRHLIKYYNVISLNQYIDCIDTGKE